MKITQKQLNQLIQEELGKLLKEETPKWLQTLKYAVTGPQNPPKAFATGNRRAARAMQAKFNAPHQQGVDKEFYASRKGKSPTELGNVGASGKVVRDPSFEVATAAVTGGAAGALRGLGRGAGKIVTSAVKGAAKEAGSEIAGNVAMDAASSLVSNEKEKENRAPNTQSEGQMHITRKRLSEIIREELQETAPPEMAARNAAESQYRSPSTGVTPAPVDSLTEEELEEGSRMGSGAVSHAGRQVANKLAGWYKDAFGGRNLEEQEELEEMIREELADALSK